MLKMCFRPEKVKSFKTEQYNKITDNRSRVIQEVELLKENVEKLVVKT